MRINKRWLLIALLAMTQACCLLAGVAAFANWLQRELHQVVREQVLADNDLIAGQMARMIEQMSLADLKPDSPAWLKMQTLIETIRLPNEGFLCIVDASSGRLVCHPQIRRNPALKQMAAGLELLSHGDFSKRIIELDSANDPLAGAMPMPDGIHLIAVRDLAGLGAKVIAHQREAGVAAAIERMIKPVRAVGVTIALALVGLTTLLTTAVAHRYDNKLATVNASLEQLVARRTESLMKTRDAVIFGLAKLAESRDNDTGAHLERIQSYATLLAEKLAERQPEINRAYLKNLALASSLHDIGKVGIPDAILLKPGPLTPQERQIMQRHAQIGGDCLNAIVQRLGEDDFLAMARTIAYAHHERWDGAGYPSGLREEAIPLAARLVALADVYDALTTERVYKKAMSHLEAKAIIVAGSGSQFDPEVVAAFLSREAEFQRIAEAQSSLQAAGQQPPLAALHAAHSASRA